MMNKAHFNTITILVDNDSWILPYAQELTDYFSARYDCQLVRSANDIKLGDVCFLLGCTKIVSKDILTLNQYNLIVHESALPKGKGFAPVTWQIIDGEKSIPVCLIEASDNVDSGQVWLKDTIELNGNELHDEWRDKQGKVTIKLAKDFIENFMRLNAEEQNGQASFYARRSIKDSELNIDKSLAEQFNLLRVVSNSDYPAFFIKDGVKYKLEISRHD
ncbi:MAG: methionyl-tRNA formyltransferase [Paraglaciecola sp.]|jgi:methionyl-tRNA formyltransferase